jgi:hypothetical protein
MGQQGVTSTGEIPALTTLEHVATILHHIHARAQGSTQRWVAVDDLIRDSGLTPDQVEAAIEFLFQRGLVLATGTPAHSLRLTPAGQSMARPANAG